MLKGLELRLLELAQKTSVQWDDFLVENLGRLKSSVVFIWLLYLVLPMMSAGVRGHTGLRSVVVVATLIQIVMWGFAGIRFWRERVLQKKIEEQASSASVIGLLYFAVQMAFIITVVLLGLSNLGIDIGALLAGLGVGGIAVALAAQNVLGDLLASLSIVLDKPFVLGDFIVVGEEKGTVKNIGIKTTRVQSLSGEELVFSNKDLLESRIRNFKKMYERRVVQSFGVVYGTSAEKLKAIPGWVKPICESQHKVRFDRCHFCRYGDSSLDFELVFFVSDPDFNFYMDAQENILLQIFRKFEAEGIDFAFPTRTLYVETKQALPAPGSPPPLPS
ncbi:MAG: mechanosensitive ion channel family protein [Bdellovibrionales bacterium]